MDKSLLLILVAAVVVPLLIIFARRSRRREGPMLVQTKPLPRIEGSLKAERGRIDVALGREILQFLENGQKLQAVKLVRERTGWSLAESVEAVEKLEGLRKRIES